MIHSFRKLNDRRHEWLTFVMLMLFAALPASGFASVLSSFSSEAEIEFFGEEEVEQGHLTEVRCRSSRQAAGQSGRQLRNRAAQRQARHISMMWSMPARGHRLSNGLLAPIRC